MENDYNKVSFEDENRLMSSQVSSKRRDRSFTMRTLKKLGVRNEKNAEIIILLISLILIFITISSIINTYTDLKVKTHNDLSELEKRSVSKELIETFR